jgi:hypothetical protein
MPIAAGRLEVTVGEVRISSKTIDALADRLITDKQVVAIGSSFTKGFRRFAKGVLADPATLVTLKSGWNKDRVIPPSAFPDGSIEELRGRLENGDRIAIELPLTLKLKTGQKISTSFNVFVEAAVDLERNEEAFVRMDLLIGSESHVTAGSFVQRTRSLTWIQNRDLSDFLLSAEEPTHLKWNASLARDKADYVAPELALRSIRQAVPRLLSVLLSGTEKKDVKALAKYFSRPANEQTKKPGDEGKSKKPGGVTPPPIGHPPPPQRKPFRLDPDGTTIRVRRSGPNAFEGISLPLTVVLELAYEGLDQDPFDAYDPYDFDVAQGNLHPISSHGCAVRSKGGNRIELEVTDPDFAFSISGFDSNMRLRARLGYDVGSTTSDTSVEEESDG